MILRPWFWFALILAALWAPVVVVEAWIDPPTGWVTQSATANLSKRQR